MVEIVVQIICYILIIICSCSVLEQTVVMVLFHCNFIIKYNYDNHRCQPTEIFRRVILAEISTQAKRRTREP